MVFGSESGKSLQELADIFGVNKNTVECKLRRLKKSLPVTPAVKSRNILQKDYHNRLVIGDMHEPYCHKYYLEFCERIHKEYDCDEEVSFIGDLADFHSMSYHEINPSLPNPDQELDMAIDKIKGWQQVFPKALVCAGNHDELLTRKAVTHGLAKRGIRSFPDLFEFPQGWSYSFDHIVNDVRYYHGTRLGGQFPFATAVTKNRMSCVIGHLHTVAGVHYTATKKDLLFGMSVGCGIDINSPAFDYNKHDDKRPILGCGVVSYTIRGVHAKFIPMELK